jgi:hypothetical protein
MNLTSIVATQGSHVLLPKTSQPRSWQTRDGCVRSPEEKLKSPEAMSRHMRVFGVKSFVRPAEPISDRRAMRKRKSAIKTVDLDEIGGLINSAALRGWRRHAELDRASQVLSRTPTGLGFEVHVTSREAVGVRDDEARGVALLDIPRRWEAARRNGHSRAMDGEPANLQPQPRVDFLFHSTGTPASLALSSGSTWIVISASPFISAFRAASMRSQIS